MRLTQVNQKGEGGVFAFVILLNQVLKGVQPGYLRCALPGSAERELEQEFLHPVSHSVLRCVSGFWGTWDTAAHYTSLLNLGFPKLF